MICLIKLKDTIYDISQERSYRVGAFMNDDIVINNPYADKLTVKNGLVTYNHETYSYGKHAISLSDDVHAELFVFEYTLQTLMTNVPITIGPEAIHTVRIVESDELLIRQIPTGYEVVTSKPIFLNGQKVNASIQMSEGDSVFSSSGYLVKIDGQRVLIASIHPIESELIQLDVEENREDKFSDFHRSPRFILREPDDVVSILAPPTEDNMQKQSLLKLIIMPLAMIGLTVATHFLTGNGGMMIMMMGMSVITLITSVHSFFSDKKQNKRLKAKRWKTIKRI